MRLKKRIGAAKMPQKCWALATKRYFTKCANSIWIPGAVRALLRRRLLERLLRKRPRQKKAHRRFAGRSHRNISAVGFGIVVRGRCASIPRTTSPGAHGRSTAEA